MATRQYRRPAIALLYCLVLVLTGGCHNRTEKDEGASAEAAIQHGGIYRKGLENEPRTLDPALVSSTYEVAVVQQIFDGLVQFDANWARSHFPGRPVRGEIWLS